MKDVYFGKGEKNNYEFINLMTGENKVLIPNDYEIINQEKNLIFPEYLILKKLILKLNK